MRKSICSTIVMILLFGSIAHATPLQPDTVFPDITLEGNLTGLHRNYLNLKGNGPWHINELDADYIILEIYSMYCPHCQKEAPVVNTFYDMLSKSKECSAVKFFGIAAGNSEYEVNFFKKKFEIKFPIFTDQDLKIHSEIGEPGTPHFFMLKKEGESYKIVISHEGPFKSPEKFLNTVKENL
ncbi:redoxin family protein [Maridesulfovibrio sp.]|uniref:TlpA family protein disulfide reductase n=1 Tax=Maridesulfovibrio sp. TaxID=2795000 RepID=UPI0029F49301|nr:redoxin family protein [Maridesulfovibrio sp.]